MIQDSILGDLFFHRYNIIFVFVSTALIYAIMKTGKRPKGCPPGPPTLPIIGNLHQLPKKDLHLAYQKWGEKYGPIFSLQLGQQTSIVLTNGDVIKRLVDKRSANYSDRPDLYMQHIWEHSRIIMRGYDDLWKVERKLYHHFLNSTIAAKYIPYQSVETKKICFDFLVNPEGFGSHIARMTTSLSASMTYGFRIESPDSPVMQEMIRVSHGFFKLVHENRFFDSFPSIRSLAELLPIALNPIAKKATKVYHDERTLYMKLYNDVKEKRHLGKSHLPNFAADITEAQKEWKDNSLLTDKAASYIAGISFEGGADTSSNTLMGFIKAMTLFPEAQKEAQMELDRVVGNKLMPGIEHFKDLPYVRATVKESLRWLPTAINGAIPHAARSADNFDGYHIPKGASIVLAVWSCNNDSELFDEPRLFNPARHRTDLSLGEAAIAPNYRDRDQWTFGAGRRLCPGIHVAERTLFLAIARILWGFEISLAKDANGNTIPIEHDAVTQSIAAAPMRFKCTIKPRSPMHEEVIRKEWQSTQQLFGPDGNYKENIIKVE